MTKVLITSSARRYFDMSRRIPDLGTVARLIEDMRVIAPAAVRIKIWERRVYQVRIRIKLKKWRRRHDEQCHHAWQEIERMRPAWAVIGIRYEIIVT